MQLEVLVEPGLVDAVLPRGPVLVTTRLARTGAALAPDGLEVSQPEDVGNICGDVGLGQELIEPIIAPNKPAVAAFNRPDIAIHHPDTVAPQRPLGQLALTLA